MEDRIAALPDAEAIRLVRLIGSAHVGAGDGTEGLTPAQQTALRETFDVAPPSPDTVSEGDLARTALLLYAQDPAHREDVAAMLDGPAPEHYGIGTAIALTTAVLFILKTRLRFERDKDGKWTVLVESEPTSNNLLKELAQKLLGVSFGKA